MRIKDKEGGYNIHFRASAVNVVREAIRHIRPVFACHLQQPTIRVFQTSYDKQNNEYTLALRTSADTEWAHNQFDLADAFISGYVAAKGKKW